MRVSNNCCAKIKRGNKALREVLIFSLSNINVCKFTYNEESHRHINRL